MPTFNFSLPKKETKARKTSNHIKQHEVIEKNIIGIVWIDEFANFTVRVRKNFIYNIHPDCYSCKGKVQVYARNLDKNRRICVIRNIGDYPDCNPNCYLPFAPGCVVSGDIIINGFTKQFYIKKCWVELENDDAHAALVYYRNNYNAIRSILENNKLNESR